MTLMILFPWADVIVRLKSRAKIIFTGFNVWAIEPLMTWVPKTPDSVVFLLSCVFRNIVL